MCMDRFQKISDKDGESLVRMARKTVHDRLKNNLKNSDDEFDLKFNFNSGVFVTINKNNSLRGCIGFPLPFKKLSEGLMDAAISAAINDTRFSPLTIDELNQVVFEVTILSNPEEINVNNSNEYLSIIKIGRDGLIVENSGFSGLLLPQVPKEYGWNVEEFLSFTCEKAGLNPNSWKESSTKISKFEGVIFKEKSPNGEVVRESTKDVLNK